jgi:hypothetical protein
MAPSGSFAKGTANKSGTDIDIFVSVSTYTPENLREVYTTLFTAMQVAQYAPKKQNVSINVKVGPFDVDLVPGKRQDNLGTDHSLYRRRADTWTKTNVLRHIAYVQNSKRTNEIRLTKIWRNQHGLDFPSFYLELTVIDALKFARVANLSANMVTVWEYLRDHFPAARVKDPANTNNMISEDLNAAEKALIKAAAGRALSGNWEDALR